MVAGRRRRSRSILAQLLLVASAIQGLTPDADDIASTSLVWLLCPAPAGSSSGSKTAAARVCDDLGRELPPLDGTLPPWGDDQDELPDEVCLPVAVAAGMAQRERPGGSPCHEPATCRRAERPFVPGPDGRAATLAGIARGDVLIRSLCRLNC
jgi:hypothetical protein